VVQMDDLAVAEGFVVADVLHVHLDDLEGFGAVPVYELSGFLPRSVMGDRGSDPSLVSAQDVADGSGRDTDSFLSQIEGQADGAFVSQILHVDDLFLDLRRSSVRLASGSLGAVFQITLPLFLENVIDHRASDAKGSGSVGYVAPVGLQILKDSLSGCLRIDLPQALVVDTGSRIHSCVPSGCYGICSTVREPCAHTPHTQGV